MKKRYLQIEIPIDGFDETQREQIIGDVFRLIDNYPVGQFEMVIVHYEDIGEDEEDATRQPITHRNQ